MTSPTTIRLALSCTLLLTAGFASRVNAEDYAKSYTVTERPSVRIHTDDGKVHITTSDTHQVDFRVKSEGSNWGIGFGGGPTVESHQNGAEVDLEATSAWHFGFGISTRRMNIEVQMPADADLQVNTADGSIEVSAVHGKIVAHTADGSIKASQLTGTVDITTDDGSIRVDTVKGDLRLHTSNGSIGASHLDGKCQVSSNDGRIDVAGRFDALDIRADDGGVTARVEAGSAMTSDWHIRTSDGSINVALPTDFKANLDASTSDGHITLDLPVEVHGDVSKSHVHGALNGGGESMLIRTDDGGIHVSGI